MQQDPNLQAPFNQNEYQQNAYGGYPSQAGYPSQGGYPQPNSQAPFTQPAAYPQFNNYNGYQQNVQGVQPGYPPVYNAQTYQQPYGGQPQGQVVVGTGQMQAMNAQNAAHGIETRIISGFCCYTCLVYFELLVSLSQLIFGIIVVSNLGDGGYIALNVSSAVVMFIGCILALVAKANFDRSKQSWAMFFFIVATILTVTTTVLILVQLEDYRSEYEWCYDNPYYYNNYNNSDYTDDVYCDEQIIGYAVISAFIVSFIAAIPIQLLIGLGLICSAYALVQLMKQRDNHLAEAKRNLDNGVVIAA